MTTARELREALVGFLERDLIGPADGHDEVLEDQPVIRYAAGVLFPSESTMNESDASGGIEGAGVESDGDTPLSESDEGERSDRGVDLRTASPEADYDDPVTLANSYRPSAMGLSFMVGPECRAFDVKVRASTYETSSMEIERSDGTPVTVPRWRRRPLEIPSETFVIGGLASSSGDERRGIAAGLKLAVVQRPRKEGCTLITVSLYNETRAGSRDAVTF